MVQKTVDFLIIILLSKGLVHYPQESFHFSLDKEKKA